MWPLTAGSEAADDLADSRREDVDAADDQHVVGAADAADPRARSTARARGGADHDVVAGAEPQQRRAPGGADGSGPARRVAPSASSIAAPVSGSISSGCTNPRAPRCIPSCALALAPQRDADVADPHRLGDPCAPALLELGPEGRLAAARLARDEHPLDARAREVDIALGRPLDQVGGVRRRQRRGLRLEQLDRGDEPLGVAGPERDVAQPDAFERRQRRAGDERSGVVGRDDPLPGGDPRGRVAARRAGDPVARGRRRSAGCSSVCRSCRWSSRCGRSRRRRAQVGADRIVGRAARPQLALFGQRQLRDLGEAAGVARRREPAAPSLSR